MWGIEVRDAPESSLDLKSSGDWLSPLSGQQLAVLLDFLSALDLIQPLTGKALSIFEPFVGITRLERKRGWRISSQFLIQRQVRADDFDEPIVPSLRGFHPNRCHLLEDLHQAQLRETSSSQPGGPQRAAAWLSKHQIGLHGFFPRFHPSGSALHSIWYELFVKHNWSSWRGCHDDSKVCEQDTRWTSTLFVTLRAAVCQGWDNSSMVSLNVVILQAHATWKNADFQRVQGNLGLKKQLGRSFWWPTLAGLVLWSTPWHGNCLPLVLSLLRFYYWGLCFSACPWCAMGDFWYRSGYTHVACRSPPPIEDGSSVGMLKRGKAQVNHMDECPDFDC